MSRPVLADLPLVQVQTLAVDDTGAQARDRVPGLEGDVVDTVGRRSHRVLVTGVLSGPTAADDLARLRALFRDAAPVPFTADVAQATQLSQVVVEGLTTRELAGRPERVEYVLALREHVPPPAAVRRAPEPVPGPVDGAATGEAQQAVASQVDAVAGGRGTLEVQVRLAVGGEGPDAYAGIVVHVEPDDGADDGAQGGVQGGAAGYRAVGTEQVGGVYRFTDVPAGTYRVRVDLR